MKVVRFIDVLFSEESLSRNHKAAMVIHTCYRRSKTLFGLAIMTIETSAHKGICTMSGTFSGAHYLFLNLKYVFMAHQFFQTPFGINFALDLG